MDPLVLRALAELGIAPSDDVVAVFHAINRVVEARMFDTTYERNGAQLLARAILADDAAAATEAARWVVDPEAAMDLAMARVQRETRALDAEAVAPC